MSANHRATGARGDVAASRGRWSPLAVVVALAVACACQPAVGRSGESTSAAASDDGSTSSTVGDGDTSTSVASTGASTGAVCADLDAAGPWPECEASVDAPWFLALAGTAVEGADMTDSPCEVLMVTVDYKTSIDMLCDVDGVSEARSLMIYHDPDAVLPLAAGDRVQLRTHVEHAYFDSVWVTIRAEATSELLVGWIEAYSQSKPQFGPEGLFAPLELAVKWTLCPPRVLYPDSPVCGEVESAALVVTAAETVEVFEGQREALGSDYEVMVGEAWRGCPQQTCGEVPDALLTALIVRTP